MTTLNLRQIEVFRAVMMAGSIAGAAQMLFVSQPAISRLLAHTEQRVGFALFQRIKGRLHATTEAKRLFHEVEEVYEGVQRINALATDLARNRNGMLNVVSSPSVGQRIVPQALAEFREKYPDSKLTFGCHNYEQLSEQLLKHQADLGIVSMPIDHPHLKVVPLCVSRLMCVLPNNHVLSEKATLTLSDIIAYPTIGYEHGTRLGRKIADYFAVVDTAPIHTIEVASPQNALSLAEFGMGIAIVDEFSACGSVPRGSVTVRPLVDAPALQTSFVHHRYEPVSRLTQSFVTLFRNVLSQQGFTLSGEEVPLAIDAV